LGNTTRALEQKEIHQLFACIDGTFAVRNRTMLICGIAMALRGGQLAADHIVRFLAGERAPASTMSDYTRAWRTEFGARVRVGRLAQALMLRPSVFGLALHLLNAAPSLGRYFVTRTRDLRGVTDV